MLLLALLLLLLLLLYAAVADVDVASVAAVAAAVVTEPSPLLIVAGYVLTVAAVAVLGTVQLTADSGKQRHCNGFSVEHFA